MKPLTRRSVTAGLAAAVPTVATLSVVPALAEDAELVRLWHALKAGIAEHNRLIAAFNAAEEAAIGEYPNRWAFHSIESFPSRAVFVCGDEGLVKVVKLRSKGFEKVKSEARKIEAGLRNEYDQAAAAARQHVQGRSGRGSFARRSYDRVNDVQEQIAETPAESIAGVCIKLAAALREEDFMQEPALALVRDAYAAATKLAGVDYAAQAEPWA